MLTYRITGIIHGRKVSWVTFFAVVREKTFAIQVISLYKNSSRDRNCKKTFANPSRFAKFAKLFFRGWFPLYSICWLFAFLHFYTTLYNSCWIKSDDGAIAAFIVPIVAIMLVRVKISINCSELLHFADQLHILSHYSKSIISTKNNQ